jgi:enterochelin esterase family protein
LDRFWAEVAEGGTPLIEPSQESGHALVTVLLRQSADEPMAYVSLGLGGLDPMDRALRRLPGTDVMHWTRSSPADLRTVYGFAPHAGMDLTDVRQDPLARKQYVYLADEDDPDDREMRVSMVELPAAPAARWSERRGAPAGRVELHRLRSNRLGGERRLYAYTPPDYEDVREQCALLILFDGWAFTQLVSAPTSLDNLLLEGAAPPLVAVMPDSPDNPTRMRDLWLSDTFNGFLAEELLPWARNRWRLSPSPSGVVAAGSSLGGLAAAYFGMERPDLVGGVLSMSGAFQLSPDGDPEPMWTARELARRPTLPIRFWLNAGTVETHPAPDNGISQVSANRHVRDVLRARGYDVTYGEYPGGHDYFWWAETLGDGVAALLGVN